MCEAFGKSACVATALNGFRRTGICSFDDDVFGEEEFVVTNESISTEPITEKTIIRPSDIFSIPNLHNSKPTGRTRQDRISGFVSY